MGLGEDMGELENTPEMQKVSQDFVHDCRLKQIDLRNHWTYSNTPTSQIIQESPDTNLLVSWQVIKSPGYVTGQNSVQVKIF